MHSIAPKMILKMVDEKVGKLPAILVIATHDENYVWRRLLKSSYFENN
jgi:hypothetical protein